MHWPLQGDAVDEDEFHECEDNSEAAPAEVQEQVVLGTEAVEDEEGNGANEAETKEVNEANEADDTGEVIPLTPRVSDQREFIDNDDGSTVLSQIGERLEKEETIKVNVELHKDAARLFYNVPEDEFPAADSPVDMLYLEQAAVWFKRETGTRRRTQIQPFQCSVKLRRSVLSKRRRKTPNFAVGNTTRSPSDANETHRRDGDGDEATQSGEWF